MNTKFYQNLVQEDSFIMVYNNYQLYERDNPSEAFLEQPAQADTPSDTTDTSENNPAELPVDNKLDVVTGEMTTWKVWQDLHASDSNNSNNGQNRRKYKYVVTILINKDDASTISLICNAITAAWNEGLKRFGDSFTTAKHYPFHDGDEKARQDAKYKDYKGKYYVYCRSNDFPVIFDADNNAVEGCSASSLKNCEGPAYIELYPYSYEANGTQEYGIGCSLNGLMLRKNNSYCCRENNLERARNAFARFTNK